MRISKYGPCLPLGSAGEPGHGIMMSERIFTMCSLAFGGHLPEATASARMRLRSSRSLYGQTWMIWFNGPISVYQNAARGDSVLRYSIVAVQRSSTLGSERGLRS